ncbi:MAG: DUF5050 domain-containing protein [Lachnospiraceae bacterium]|nr:DUF5050 domain-containing protein [Lachnospiraceae bacterium]
MKKINTRSLIIIIILAVLAVGAGVFTIVRNTRDVHIEEYPMGTIGNIAGNINNGGLFCELSDRVYFANAFDNDTLYSMNVDETDIKKVSGAVISNIIGAGDYIFYFQRSASGETGLGGVRVPNSFNRLNVTNNKSVSLLRGVVTSGQLVDNTLYLQGMDDNGAYFASIDVNGNNYTEIGRYVLNPASAFDGSIYYNQTVGNHFLNRFDTRTGANVELLTENVWNPILYGDGVYYMDPGNEYQLRRYNLSSQTIDILTKSKVQAFNVGNGYIYYQTMDSTPGLYFMATDGSGVTLIANGQYCDINMTSRYVYFKDYFEEAIIYHAFIGNPSYTAFSAASPIISEK